MKRSFVLSIIFLLFTLTISAQWGGRVYNFRPTGKDGAVFKPTYTAEILYHEPFENRFRQSYSFTFLNLKTRIPEIPTTGIIERDGQVTITPGKQIFNKFLTLQARAGYDFAIIKKNKFSTFIGANIIFGASYVDYSSEVALIESTHITTVAYGVGIQFRSGVEYQVSDDFGLFISANKNIYLMLNEDISDVFWSNDFGLGFTYNF